MIQSLDTLPKLLQAERFIPMLAALLLRGDDQTGGQVFEPDCRFRLVDVLASWAARAEGVNLAFPQQVFVRFRQYNHVHPTFEMATDDCYNTLSGLVAKGARGACVQG